MTANNGKVDRRTLLKMMGAAGASAAVISGCGPSSISGQGLSGAEFNKSVPLATAGPGGGGKNWKPGYALQFLPPEDMPMMNHGHGEMSGMMEHAEEIGHDHGADDEHDDDGEESHSD